jgi:hypothetical protein
MEMNDETKAMWQEAAVMYNALAWSKPQILEKLNRLSISGSKLLSVSELHLLHLQKIVYLCLK